MNGWVNLITKNRLLLGMGGLGVLFILLAVAYLNRPYRYQGAIIDPPMPLQDFTLTDGNRDAFRLSTSRGKFILVFFGYTHCPDVCPITLSQFKQVKANLKEKAEDVAFIFVTVDPKRDTPEVLSQHLQRFDPGFIGLSGSEEELTPVWSMFGVYREIRESSTADTYLVDHTARIYLIDPQGRLVLTYPYDIDYRVLLGDLLHLMKERG